MLQRVAGRRLDLEVEDIRADHRTYFHTLYPGILERFIRACQAIHFLHQHGETHGDIRRDHLYVDRDSGEYCWIDFDYGYDAAENPFGLDLFGLGNILSFITGKGVHTIQDRANAEMDGPLISEADCSLFFRHRIVNLRKLFPYVPEELNRVLMGVHTGDSITVAPSQTLTDDEYQKMRDAALAIMGREGSGAHTALPIWLAYRQAIENQYPPDDFLPPEGIVWARVENSQAVGSKGQPAPESYFLPFIEGTQPAQTDVGAASSSNATSNDADLMKQGLF